MGNRVHVVKRQCQYGNTEAFNWKAEEFAALLSTLGADVCTNVEGFYDQFEVPVEDYKKALRIIKAVAKADGDNAKIEKIIEKASGWTDDDGVAIGVTREEFDSAVEDTGESIGRIAEAMQGFYEERDKNSKWMQFHSW